MGQGGKKGLLPAVFFAAVVFRRWIFSVDVTHPRWVYAESAGSLPASALSQNSMEKEGECNNENGGKNIGKYHKAASACGKRVREQGAEARTLELYSAVLWNPLST